jgi:hypothetical protein
MCAFCVHVCMSLCVRMCVRVCGCAAVGGVGVVYSKSVTMSEETHLK